MKIAILAASCNSFTSPFSHNVDTDILPDSILDPKQLNEKKL